MIFNSKPPNWKDLQKYVCQVFREMGCLAEEGKQIETIRGASIADVYIVDSAKAPEMVYIVECKYWNKRVPKSEVRVFRTIISDYGAHMGIIISQKGFQKGAYDVAINTNVHLFSWEEFNSYFFNRWLRSMSKNLEVQARKLIKYTTFDFQDYDFKDSYHWDIFRKWQVMERKSMSYGLVVNRKPKLTLDDFPIRMIDPERDLQAIEPGDLSIFIDFITPRQYFDFML